LRRGKKSELKKEVPKIHHVGRKIGKEGSITREKASNSPYRNMILIN